ncbi:MAG: two-component regulator propeller domain-containing protein [Fulvivirga sp.]
MRKRSFLQINTLLLVFFVTSNWCIAQRANYRTLDFFDNNNGLSQGTVNSIVQDKYGYIWLGTQDGLNKFDGLNFTVYKSDPDVPTSINDNFITSMVEDYNGDLWIGTRNGGLNRYDIKTGLFESFKTQADNPKSISYNWVISLHITADSTLWVGTQGGGLNRFNREDQSFDVFKHDVRDSGTLSSNNMQCILQKDKNTLWIGTDKGLNEFNIQTGVIKKYLNDQENSESISNNDILSLYQDNNETLYAGTNGGGLNVKNGDSFISYVSDPNASGSITSNNVISLLPGDPDEIWVATDGGGLLSFNVETKRIVEFQVSFPRLNTLYLDNNSNLWIGERGGLNKIGKHSGMFTIYKSDVNGDLIAPNGDIHALCEDKEGFIWSGTSVGGLKRLDPKTLETKTYVHTSEAGSICSSAINFLLIDSKDRIWVGTLAGLSRYVKETDSFINFLPGTGPKSLSAGRVNFIYEDSKNQIWICTDNGLNRYDEINNQFDVIKNDPFNPNSLLTNNLSTIVEDSDGIYWIGYSSRGFGSYDAEKSIFKNYEHQDDNPNSPANDRIAYLYDDGKGNLWLATYGGGLDKFEKNSEKFTHYNEKQGLANPSLYYVINDEFGNLWMSHNDGISRFNIESETFNNYLKGVEFNGRAHYKSPDGKILLGGFDIVTFYAEDITTNETIPPVHINEFKLFNELVVAKDSLGILSQLLEQTDSITLNHDQNFFSFGFVALNFTDAVNNKYKYMLVNFDDRWRQGDGNSHAYYTNVPPGNYVFKVQGSNNDGLWNEEGDKIYIKILAPWWDSWWFKVALLIAFLMIFVIFYKLRLSNIKQQKLALEKLVNQRTSEVLEQQQEILAQKESISDQNEQLKALNEEKNDLMQIVAHDLRSPLNQIKGLASIIKIINPDLNTETTNSIDLINDLVDRQSTMIGKILDTNAIDAKRTNVNMSSQHINPLLQRIVNTLKVVGAAKSTTIELNLSEKEPQACVDPNYLIQILENIISNAIKFSPRNSKVRVSTIVEDGKVRIGVEDEGPGISDKEMRFLFEPYSKLSARPTANEQSSGLGLSIAKKYVEVMRGKIWCEGAKGKGAKFFVEFDEV